MYFFLMAVASCLIAQTMKLILETIIEKKFSFRRFFGDGGYPSGHSAFVTGGFVAAIFKHDWSKDILSTDTNSLILAVFAVLWVITIRDALGTRRQQGQTANHLNEITKYFRKNIDDNFFKMFPILKKQGHLPHEANAGIAIGIIAPISLMNMIDKGKPLMTIIAGTIGLLIVIGIGILINLRKNK